MEQKLKDIREACIKVNPEIVELKFGCWIRIKDGSCPDSPITSVEPMSDGNWETSWGCFHPELSASRYEILGRPIRLADVLLALYEKKVVIAVDTYGCFMLYLEIEDENNSLGWTDIVHDENRRKWNLLKDSLTDQSEETIYFIHSLLK